MDQAPPDTCTFCGNKTERGSAVRGKHASICTRCVGLAVVSTLRSSSLVEPTESLMGDKGNCALCGNPSPTAALYRAEREGAGACTTCLQEAMGALTHQRALQDWRREALRLAQDGTIASLIEAHFHDLAPEQIVTTSRAFAGYLRADLYLALEAQLAGARAVGYHRRYSHETCTYSDLIEKGHDSARQAPIRFEEVDVGEQRAVRCARGALWLGNTDGVPFVTVLARAHEFGRGQGWQVEIAAPASEAGVALANRYFRALENAIAASGSYRGKVLSLDCEQSHSGTAPGTITVHRLARVSREEIILPGKTLELLERNVFGFVAHRKRLRELGMPVKKGLLLYGPPGTGKTHAIRYLAAALTDHTTLLVTADQVQFIREYMALARLLSPALVVIEDADLIARQREDMDAPVQESLLNALLNEMDGLRDQAEVFFVLTTNRPESLEAAIAGRPGRIDQAIEFPLPDDAGRRKLIELYRCDMDVPDALMDEAVRRTDGTSAAFIKELMRRVAQRALERGEDVLEPGSAEIDAALGELLSDGGSLNATLLGATGARRASDPSSVP